MAKGYWIFHATITDPATYQQYVGKDGPVFASYGARFLVRGGDFVAAEGTARQRHVVIEFESYDKALACYRSPEYQAVSEFRRAGAITDLVIIQGTG